MSKSDLFPSFEVQAARVIEAIEVGDAAVSRMRDEIAMAFQLIVDACAGLPKDKSTIERIGKEVRETQAFVDAVAVGLLEKKTVTEYAQSTMRAVCHGVPWEAGLKNNPEYALPWSKKGGDGAAKAKPGKVQSTSRADLDKSICAVLQQARLLGLTEFAANVLDLALESLDGFEEPAI